MTDAVLIRPCGGSSPRISGSSTSASVAGKQTKGTGMERSSENNFERFFNERFARFLQENFRNPTQVAAAFNVRERTAENWWNGVNCPGGAKVALAFKEWPEKAARLLTDKDAA